MADAPISSSSSPLVTGLDRLKRGQRGVVQDVDGEDPVARRLVDLGFRAGTEVLVERVAPLGDPIQYRLHGYRLALRKGEARRVRVVAAAASASATATAPGADG